MMLFVLVVEGGGGDVDESNLRSVLALLIANPEKRSYAQRERLQSWPGIRIVVAVDDG
jgi:hypothetical protein